jgi:hypothetical protein
MFLPLLCAIVIDLLSSIYCQSICFSWVGLFIFSGDWRSILVQVRSESALGRVEIEKNEVHRLVIA